MNIVYVVTGFISVVTGIVGGLILRQHVARLDERNAARRDGSFPELSERPVTALNRPGREGLGRG